MQFLQILMTVPCESGEGFESCLFWRVYLHGIQLSVVKLDWMSEVVFRRLAEMINEPADEASAGFSASFGLDFVWKNPSTKGGRR